MVRYENVHPFISGPLRRFEIIMSLVDYLFGLFGAAGSLARHVYDGVDADGC